MLHHKSALIIATTVDHRRLRLSLFCKAIWLQWRTKSWAQAPVSLKHCKAIFSSSVSKNGELYVPESSCMKGASVHIKNMWIKQLCNCKVRDFAMALRARKVSGAFEKRAPVPNLPNVWSLVSNELYLRNCRIVGESSFNMARRGGMKILKLEAWNFSGPPR